MASEGAAPRPVRVVVCDDHRVLLDAMTVLLDQEPDIEVVATAATVAEVLDVSAAAQPAVVLMDYDLPDGTGIDATESLLSAQPDCRVVMLTSFTDDEVLAAAIRAGASGFVPKYAAAAEVAGAVRRAAAGEIAVAPDLLAHLLRNLPGSEQEESELSDHERRLLEELSHGASNRQIAERLHLSPNTVRNQLSRLYARLGARSRLEAVAVAMKAGLIPPP